MTPFCALPLSRPTYACRTFLRLRTQPASTRTGYEVFPLPPSLRECKEAISKKLGCEDLVTEFTDE